MTRLDAARERLERAVARLEQAVAEGTIRGNEADPSLREALDGVRTDYEALQEIAQTVRRQLDSAIHRLENLLEH